MIIPFATQSYKLDSLPISAQRAINCYAEREPPDAKTQVAVLGAPGLTTFATCGTGPVRGMWVSNSILYVVSGQTLYSVSSTGVATALGGNVLGNGNVAMSDNGTQIVIVNGTQGYVYSSAAGFTLISDVNFHSANTVTFFDNVFVYDWAGTNKFFISDSLDATTYNGLAFASAEVSPDFVLTTVNQQETMLIFGTKTIETWYDAGAPNMPFLRVDGGTIERGCAAAKTPIKQDNAVFFLGDDLIFYRLSGTAIQRVSTHAIEAAWRGYTIVSDAFTMTYTFEGHKFVTLTFPIANVTWELDIATGLWHERESWDSMNRSLGRWRGNCQATCYNQELIGDAYSGKIGYVDKTSSLEFGNTQRYYMVSPPIHSDRKRVTIPRLELDFEAGVGISTGQGSDPQVMLDWSKDGGHSFLPFQVWQSMGATGAYMQRMRWLRLGQSREWMFRVQITDPVRRSLIAANADITVGM